MYASSFGGHQPVSPSKAGREPLLGRCSGRFVKRSNLLRLEKLGVSLLVAYALFDLLISDLNREVPALPAVSPSNRPHGCAFVSGVPVPAAGGPNIHRLKTRTVEDCCVACANSPQSGHFYFDKTKHQCWCRGVEHEQAVAKGEAEGDSRERGLAAGANVLSGEPSCCRALADARVANSTYYEDSFARNYDIGDLNDDGMMSETEFAQFHVVADANHDGMLTRGEFRHWLGQAVGEDDQGEYGGAVTAGLLMHVCAFQAVPLIGFGFLDNCIMIVAGDAIDSGIGKTLRISTMAAAGLGNLISDVAGLGLEDYVRLISDKIMSTPKLNHDQKSSPKVMTAQALGGILGISLGCLLGMAPLLLMGSGSGKALGGQASSAG
jgi:hypothetical protein